MLKLKLPLNHLGSLIALLLPGIALGDEVAAKRALLFSDDFNARTELGDNYHTAAAGPRAWLIADGVLVASQTQDDHGTVLRMDMPFLDFDCEMDFRFNGGTRFNFVIDDKNEKSVHAGHICRVSTTPTKMTVSDDKTGKMNLAVQALRNAKELPADKAKAIKELLAKCEKDGAVKLEKGKWYRLGVRINGDLMEASLDGKLIASLRSPGIAHLTKTQFGMTVTGASIDFDNLKVYKVAK
jgi:hypothetical protein